MKVYWQHGQKQYQGRTGHQENMTTYAVSISNLNASMRCLEERVIDFSLMQFQVSSIKQWDGLIFPSTAILKIIEMREVIFKRRVIENERGITSERSLNLKIQSGIIALIYSTISEVTMLDWKVII